MASIKANARKVVCIGRNYAYASKLHETIASTGDQRTDLDAHDAETTSRS